MLEELPGKEVLILCGPGFADQGDVLQFLRFNQHSRLKTVSIGAGATPLLISEFASADLILLRGPWTANPEEMLYASVIAERLKPSFELFSKRKTDEKVPRLLGMGRGALIIMQSLISGAETLRSATWDAELSEKGPWTPVKLRHHAQGIFGQIQGRAMPKILASEQGDLEPWLNLPSGQIAGWKLNQNTYVSFVDILSLADRSQLFDYGYVDLSGVPTQSDVLEMMLSGKAFLD